MKIDRAKLKKSSSEVPSDCRLLIERLKGCQSESELLTELKSIKTTWNYGKSELYHWIDVLDLFDSILEKAVARERDSQWSLPCDDPSNESLRELLIHVIIFTSLLIEHSFSRHLYNSMEHLTTLLSSSDMQIVLSVLNLLYVFSKRSNFISRLNSERKLALIQRLNYLAESWGGKENGFGLAECCQDLPMSSYPSSATTLHFEFYSEAGETSGTTPSTNATSSSSLPGSSSKTSSSNKTSSSSSSGVGQTLTTIHIDSVDQVKDKTVAQIMEDLVETYAVTKNKQMLLFTHLRLAHSFSNYRKRLQCVQARLQALSIIVYCNAMSVQEGTNILYNGFIEELVEVLELKNNRLLEIKAAALRTLTSVIHLDHSSKLSVIIDATGASLYHGFLPSLVRSCIQALIDGNTSLSQPGSSTSPFTTSDAESFPLAFATALFSFLYHLASYENGGEALVSCGMIESLLKVISWKGTDPEHITFVTRAVRVIDLITNLDMNAFQNHNGLNIFITRLESEIEVCRTEQPFVIDVPVSGRFKEQLDTSMTSINEENHLDSIPVDGGESNEGTPMEVEDFSTMKPSTSNSVTNPSIPGPSASSSGANTTTLTSPSKDVQCYPQRAALLKSMLNFLKKAIQDPAFSDSIRHLMDGSLPLSLRHIISNAEYYGPSLFMLATDVVTVYVFQEPSLLSTLQESGLTDVVLQALLKKDIPATREVISSLPNVFSALCLNTRGLEAFRAQKPFDKVFKVLLSPEYLPAMRRRRSSDPMGDTASNLGTSMDELMRHQPSLRTDATTAIINLLNELCSLGSNPNYVCSKSSKEGGEVTTDPTSRGARQTIANISGNDGGSSDEDDDDEEDPTGMSERNGRETNSQGQEERPTTVEDVTKSPQPSTSSGITETIKTPVPLVDYILNVMRFVDAILSNNSTDDHCQEFVKQKGLVPLLKILTLPNLPVDFPTSQACVSVASVLKSIITLAQEKEVLKEGLRLLSEVVEKLQPIHKFPENLGGSVLFDELLDGMTKVGPNGVDPLQSAFLTPLLHSMAAAHAMVTMFVHVGRTTQNDMRNLVLTHWGSEQGIVLLVKLSDLYTSLVWESTILLNFCSDPTTKEGPGVAEAAEFGKHQMERLTVLMRSNEISPQYSTENEPGTPIAAMEVDGEATAVTSGSDSKSKKSSKSSHKNSPQQKQVKPLLHSSSRLGRALAELFGVLVKLSIGGNTGRQRHRQQMPNLPMPPSPPARVVTATLSKLLAKGLSWQPPPSHCIPKMRLTFYVCSVGFTAPMLFDEKKNPYHLMLQQFLKSGGQKAYFEVFQWALTQGGKVPIEQGLEHPDLPEGTGEFLDSWLLLLEKMLNPKYILETPHSLPAAPISATTPSGTPPLPPFDPIKYLIRTQKRAFEAIMHLWNRKPLKTYGERMSETILTILCHLLKGETIIQEKLAKEKEGEAVATSTTGTGNPARPGPPSSSSRRNELEEQGINPDHLQQLVDMGFTRELCIDALLQTTSLEQATDYLLSHPPPARLGISDLEAMNEEDAVSRALALSLGEEGVTGASGSTGSGAPTTDGERSSDKPKEPEPIEEEDDTPLPRDVMDDFIKRILPGCLNLLDSLPDTVYRVCDLLLAVSCRVAATTKGSSDPTKTSTGPTTKASAEWNEWMSNLFRQLIGEISANVSKLIKATEPMTREDNRSVREWAIQLVSLPEATKAATRIHVFSLLFEEKRNECASLVQETDLIQNLVHLLEATQNVLTVLANSDTTSGVTITPKWLAPVILLIDLYDKAAVSSVRKAPCLFISKRQWKWFDDRTGKWTPYTTQNNKTIDDAYKEGESVIRFVSGRRRYTIQFTNMVQINEESGSWRPIMFVADDKPTITSVNPLATSSGTEKAENGQQQQPTPMEGVSEEGSSSSTATLPSSFKSINGLDLQQCQSLIRSMVGLIGIPVDPDTLHAVMRLVLRLTRNYEMAVLFAESGGVRAMLSLTAKSNFTGFMSLATLIIRHILEEPATLRATMEKVIRSCIHHSPMTCKEMHYILRVLGPAVCRDSMLFTEVFKQVVRITLPSLTKREEDDTRFQAPNAVQLLKVINAGTPIGTTGGNGGITISSDQKSTSSNTSPQSTPSKIIKSLICDLLNSLTVKPPVSPTAISPTEEKDSKESKSSNIPTDPRSPRPPGSQADDCPSGSQAAPPQVNAVAVCPPPPVEDLDDDSETGASVDQFIALTTYQVENIMSGTTMAGIKDQLDAKKNRPLMNQSCLLRLLAELSKSYPLVAKIITDYSFTAGQSDLITDDCSALAFILDNLLPSTQTIGDKDCPALSRVLIAAISSCNHCPDAQSTLVSEVKSSLGRAVTIPESSEKHSRIQSLTNVMNTMIEACPPMPVVPTNPTLRQPQPPGVNNIVKMMLKKGLVNDLARVTHSLDLSSPQMAMTVNCVLKPLETLSRIVNQPTGPITHGPSHAKKPARTSAPPAMAAGQATGNENTNNSVIVNGTGESGQQGVGNESSAASVAPLTNPPTDNTTTSETNAFADGVMTADDITDNAVDVTFDLSTGNLQTLGDDDLAAVDAVMVSMAEEDHPNDESHVDQDESRVHENGGGQESGSDSTPSDEEGDSASEEDEEEEDNSDHDDQEEDDEDDEDEDDDHGDEDEVDEDDEESNLTFEDGMDPETAMIRMTERGLDDDILLDIDELMSPAVLRDGLSGLGQLIPMLDEAHHALSSVVSGVERNGDPIVIPPMPPGNVSASHPLLVRQSFDAVASSSAVPGGHGAFHHQSSLLAGTGSSSRHSRVNRHGSSRFSGFRSGLGRQLEAHTILQPWGQGALAIRSGGGGGGGHPQLQRLLFGGGGHDLLIPSIHVQAGRDLARMLTNSTLSDFQIIATADGHEALGAIGDYVDFAEPPFLSHHHHQSSSSGGGGLPSPMQRWSEESRVLDGDSMHDAVSGLKGEIVEFLEKMRNEEIEDRKLKRAKMIEEEEKRNRERKAKNGEEKNKEKTPTSDKPSIDLPTENAVNSTTEQLAANIVERVLAPFTSGGGSSETTQPNNENVGLPTDQPATVTNNPSDTSGTPRYNPPTIDLTSPSSPQPEDEEESSSESDDDDEEGVDVPRISEEAMTITAPQGSPSEIQSGGTGGSNNSDRMSTESVGPRSVEGLMEVNGSTPPPPVSPSLVSQQANEQVNVTDQGPQAQTTEQQAQSSEQQPSTESGSSAAAEGGGQSATAVQEATAPAPASSSSKDPEIPEGVDPSFLAALPENIRQEVIADQLRIQRQNRLVQQQREGGGATAATSTSGPGGPSTSSNISLPSEISPEFLAALPPNIREEVIAEHRQDQERLAAATNPDAPVDPTSFLQSLPASLRRQVLADMDDSQIALLPADLAAEARELRSELEARQRQIQDRFFASHAGSTLSRILRSAAASSGSRGGARYAIHTLQGSSWPWSSHHHHHGHHHHHSRGSNIHGGSSSQYREGRQGALSLPARFKGKQLLDHEALSCLLILLFVDEPKLNVGRLHRVLRNLSQHPTTRSWIIQSLLTIMERTRECKEVTTSGELTITRTTRKSSGCGSTTAARSSTGQHPGSSSSSSSWLSISLDAALGCKTNVFQVQRGQISSKKVASSPMAQGITIHPQAAPLVSRHVLDALISLAKAFPQSFLQTDNDLDGTLAQPKAASQPIPAKDSQEVSSKQLNRDADFWDVLVRLDSLSTTKKGKSVIKSIGHSQSSSSTETPTDDTSISSKEATPLKAVISLLSHPVVRRSAPLTDRLLRLLSLISLALPSHALMARMTPTGGPTGQAGTSGGPTTTSTATQTPPHGASATDRHQREDRFRQGADQQPTKEDLASVTTTDSKPLVGEEQIRLAVEVLTSKSCSEEGLEDVNSLLLRLSQSCPKTRDVVLKLLLAGARQLGNTVKGNIDSLYDELRSLSSSTKDDKGPMEDTLGQTKGVVHDRFTKQKVVITAPTNFRPSLSSKEVQLPSMATLTSKTSSQSFFLRILKVIIQLRESIRLQKKREERDRHIFQQAVGGRTSTTNTAGTSGQVLATGGQSENLNAEGQQQQSMEVDNGPAVSNEGEVSASGVSPTDQSSVTPLSHEDKKIEPEDTLSSQLTLDDLWDSLSRCLLELADAPDHHAVLVLQPAVEAFFLVHSSEEREPGERGARQSRQTESREVQLAHINADIPPPADGPDGPSSLATVQTLPPDTQKFLSFAETHKLVLNQILRQSTTPLVDGPFAVLVDHTRVLDFDVKRRYFRQELERLDDGVRREDLAVHVKREHVFEDSFRELYRRPPDEWKNRFYIVFEGEEGQDAGGLLREWYTIISREIFNPMYALFTTSPGDRVTYMINSASHCNSNHLQYFKFVGRVIAKAIYDNKLLECYFTRSFYKHILGKPVKYTDMESEDYAFYQGLVYLLENDMSTVGLDLTFSIEIQEFGVTEVRDLLPNGRNIPVTEDRKHEYVRLVCQEKMTGAIRKQLKSFLEGFYEIIPKRLISIFNEQETELLLSGLPNIDIDDLKANTEYHKYQATSLQIQWFWRALRSFDQADRAKFLQFVTGTSKVPLQGFASLEGMNGTQKFQIHRDDRSTDRLPSAHTCFNQLDLPAYETYDKLKTMLLKAVRECSEGFGFA